MERFPYEFWSEDDRVGKCCNLRHPSSVTCDDAYDKIKTFAELQMVRSGYDFETHGGKKVRYKGHETALTYEVPGGKTGTILGTKKHEHGHDHVWVEWDWTDHELEQRTKRIVKNLRRQGLPFLNRADAGLMTLEHHWEELEVIGDHP